MTYQPVKSLNLYPHIVTYKRLAVTHIEWFLSLKQLHDILKLTLCYHIIITS